MSGNKLNIIAGIGVVVTLIYFSNVGTYTQNQLPQSASHDAVLPQENPSEPLHLRQRVPEQSVTVVLDDERALDGERLPLRSHQKAASEDFISADDYATTLGTDNAEDIEHRGEFVAVDENYDAVDSGNETTEPEYIGEFIDVEDEYYPPAFYSESVEDAEYIGDLIEPGENLVMVYGDDESSQLIGEHIDINDVSE